MIYPNLCVDGFFDNPEEIIDFANTLDYSPCGYAPGVRTSHLHEINYGFFQNLCDKQLKLLFPDNPNNLIYEARSMFQKIPPNYKYTDWIHGDEPHQFTSIIYLTKNCDAGTNIYKRNFLSQKVNTDIKYEYFKQMTNNKLPKTKMNELIKSYEEHFKNFEKTITYKGIYNRLIGFDAYSFHGSEEYYSKQLDDRLTLITFFNKINSPDLKLKYPVTESRRF